MNIQYILRQINRELVPQFEDRLRSYLHHQDKEWLIEQIVRLTLDAYSLEENDRKRFEAEKLLDRAARQERVKALRLTESYLIEFLGAYSGISREALIHQGHLLHSAPEKGTTLISSHHRSDSGQALLQLAKDMLFGLLFGEADCDCQFDRKEREMLTLTLPRYKASCLDFMKATTEYSGFGTWQDPHTVSNDNRADNVILEIEFGEIAGEWIGKGVILCLSLINNLEVNEQILYGRMINIEQSTLVS